MSRSRPLDPRVRVDAIVQGHQLGYSLNQLRLLGLLLLLTLLLRPLILVGVGLQGGPLVVLDRLQQASESLPLLPLAFALVLLGGGRQRLVREHLLTDGVLLLLLPLALVCLLLLPAMTWQAHSQARTTVQVSNQSLLELNSRLERSLELVQQAPDAGSLKRIAEGAGLSLEVAPAAPLNVSRWQLQRLLERQLDAAAQSATPARLAETGVLAPSVLMVSLLQQILSGVALLWLDRQGRQTIRRHGLTTAQFFRSDPVRRRPAD